MKIIIDDYNVETREYLHEFLKDIGYIDEPEDMQELTLNDLRNIVHIITNGEIDIEFEMFGPDIKMKEK